MRETILPQATNSFGVIIMGDLLPIAIVTITLALVCYTIGVWAERRAGVLKKWHAIVFWLGLVFDTTGTTVMGQITKQNGGGGSGLHGVTGLLAIVLMLFHAVWATVVLVKKDAQKQQSFHKFSIFVWIVWLIPYLLGMILGMQH